MGNKLVKNIKEEPMDELEKKAMAIIDKRPDKETFLKFLEIKKTDRREILEMIVEDPTIPIHVIATNLLPMY